MGDTPRGGGSASAWALNWRNPQARKNKSWENDGFLHVQGPTLTLYGEEGNKMGQKNFLRPLAEGQELSIAGREVRLDYSITTQELFSKLRGEGSSRGTPAPAPAVRPGFFARSDSHATPQAQASRPFYGASTPHSAAPRPSSFRPLPSASTSRPRSSLSKNTDQDVFRADTPEYDPAFEDSGYAGLQADLPTSTGKTWIDPKKHIQKAFRIPTPVRRTSPALEYGPKTVVTTKSKNRSRPRMSDRAQESEEEEEDDEDEQEAARGTSKGRSSRADDMARSAIERSSRMRGKDAAQDDDDEEEVEDHNSSHARGGSDRVKEGSEPTPPKKRKLDHSTPGDSSGTTTARKPRVSAADLALSRSISTSKSASKSLQSDSKDRSKPSSRPRPSTSDGFDVQPKSETLDTTGLFLDPEDDFGVENGEGGMDWDEGNDLNEDGLLDAMSDESSESASDASGSVKSKKDLAASSGTGVAAGRKTRYFTCQWRKQSTKKNATWEGDGILRVDKSGRVTIKNTETRKEIGSAALSKNTSFKEDTLLKIGNKDVEVGTATDREAYDGEDDEPHASLEPSSSSRSYSAALNRNSSSASVPRPTIPPLSKGFSVPGIGPNPVGIRTGSFYNNPTSSLQSSKGPRPLFDPKKEGAVVMKRPDEQHQKKYNPKGYPIVDVVVDPLIGDKLRPHQREGVKFLYECAVGMSTAGLGGILADEMGLGKTIQSIALIWTLIKQNPYHAGGNRTGVIQRAMIVCPVTLMKNWHAEIKKWLGKDALRVMVADGPQSVKTFANSRTYQVLIVGYEKLIGAIDDVKYAQPPIGLVICDEGHRLKSAGTKTTKAISSLSCQRRVILSGTPIQNNLGEFFAMMDFVNPNLLGDANYFKKNFEQPMLKSRRAGASKEDRRAGKEASESLADIQRNFVLRRTSDLLQKHLPPKLEYTVFIAPNRREVEIYNQVLASSAVRSLLSGKGGAAQLSLLIMLRKCANTPGLLMLQAQSDQQKRGEDSVFESDLTNLFPTEIAYSDFTLSAKLGALGAMLKQLKKENEEKIVVVSNFTSTLDIIEKHCKKMKYPYCRLDGKTPQGERIPMVNAFNRGTRSSQFIFLLSSKSGGTGLNIIGASRLVLLDSEWNPSTDLQAMARIHRDGQTKTCVIYRFLTSGTIDEKIYQRQITKIALSGSVMEEDATSASKKGDAFTMDDLKNIFRLHTDTSCQTHDLLGCGCHRGEDPDSFPSQAEDEEGSEDEESEDEEEGGFVPASQWAGEPIDKKALKKAHRNLSILKTWNHYDCSDFESCNTIEDPLLRTLVREMYIGADQEERTVNPLSEMDEDEQTRVEQGKRLLIKGGQIGWVFEKKNEERRRKREEAAGLVEEEFVVEDDDDDE